MLWVESLSDLLLRGLTRIFHHIAGFAHRQQALQIQALEQQTMIGISALCTVGDMHYMLRCLMDWDSGASCLRAFIRCPGIMANREPDGCWSDPALLTIIFVIKGCAEGPLPLIIQHWQDLTCWVASFIACPGRPRS